MTLWLVTKFAVYDHGVCYVATTEDEALAFCREWAPDRDEYHDWRIDEVEVGEFIPPAPDDLTPWRQHDTITRRADLPARNWKPARVEVAGRDGWLLL